MKRAIFLLTLASSLIFSMGLLSFSAKKGGDVIEVYAGGKQLLQQFLHMDKTVKTVQLNQPASNDKVEVFYSHCGVTGKSRTLTIKDDKNNLLKEYRYNDVSKGRDLMSFRIKDVRKKGVNNLKLYYTSREMPEAKLLAVLTIRNENLAMMVK